MAGPGQVATEKLNIFISYSRRDLAFAERIVAALEARDFTPKIDMRDLPKLEDWRGELGGFISDADAVVFIISPHSIASQVCSWELEQVASLNKRLAPIVYQRVQNELIPSVVSRINYIFFDPPNDFEEQADAVATALRTDLGWLKEHTRIGTMARRWDGRRRPAALLLRGQELEDAEHWIATRPQGAPEPTAAHQQFIEQSRRGASRRQRLVISGSLIVAVVGLGLAGLAFWQRGIAVENAYRAEQSELEATKRRDQALLTQSRFLTDQARQVDEGQDHATALLLALEALPTETGTVDVHKQRPRWVPAEARLNAALSSLLERRILKGHSGPVNSVAVTPDGQRIVTASGTLFRSREATARIWDAASGQELLQLKGHAGSVDSVLATPDGRHILTGSADGTARLWDGATGNELLRLDNHSFEIKSVAMTPDQKRIVTGSSDGLARVWDAATGKELFEITGHDGAVLSVAITPDGAHIVTGSLDRTVRVWDAATGAGLLQIKAHTAPVYTVAVTSDGARIVTGSFDHTAAVWDATSGAELFRLKGHAGAVRAVAVTADAARIVTGSEDGTARIWDAATGTQLAVLAGHAGPVLSVTVTPDGRHIVTGSEDRTTRIWDMRSDADLVQIKGLTRPVRSIAVTPDGSRVVTGSDDGVVRMSDAKSGNELSRFEGHSSPVQSVAVMPDGVRVVTGSADHTARIFDAKTETELVRLTGHADEVLSVAVTPDGSRIITGSGDKTARIWDAATGSELLQLKGFRSPVWAVAVTPDGSRILTATGKPLDYETASIKADDKHDNAVIIWDAKTGAERAVLKGHNSTVFSMAVSPDGSRIVTGSADHTARIWDATTGAELAVLNGHSGWVESVAISPDGRRIVTGSDDTTIRVWDMQTGGELAVLKGHSGTVWLKSVRAVVTADGARIVSGSADGTARVWALPPEGQALINVARDQVPRCLAPATREQYFLDPNPPGWCADKQKWPYDPAGALVEGESLLQEAQFEKSSVVLGRQRRDKEAEAKILLDTIAGRDAGLADRVKSVWGRTYFDRGQALLVDAKDQEAAAQFDLALKYDLQAAGHIDEAWSTAYLNRGIALLEKGKDDAAAVEFELARKRNPNAAGSIDEVRAKFYFERGKTLLESDKDEEARVQFDAALKCASGMGRDINQAWAKQYTARGYRLLGEVLDAKAGSTLDRERYDQALVAFERAEHFARLDESSDTSELASALAGRGAALFDMKRYGEAVTAYREAEKLGDERAGVSAWLSMNVLSARKMSDGAAFEALLDSMESYLDLTPSQTSTIKRGDLLAQLRNIAYPIAVLYADWNNGRNNGQGVTDCDRLAGHSQDPMRIAAGVPFDQIDAEAAIRACTEAIEREPNQGRFYFERARAHAQVAIKKGIKNKELETLHVTAEIKNIEAAMVLGYPMAFNFMAVITASGEGVEKDVDKAAALFLEMANRVAACCAAGAVRKALGDDSLHDRALDRHVVQELLLWAAALENVDARDLLDELAAKGTLERVQPLPQAKFTDLPRWIKH